MKKSIDKNIIILLFNDNFFPELLLTASDKEAESTMRRMISESYPDHGIRGEEFPDRSGNGEYVWVLDPIDGTRSFITGKPVSESTQITGQKIGLFLLLGLMGLALYNDFVRLLG